MISEERLNDIINKKETVWVVYSITPEKNGVVEMTAKRYENLIKPAIILQAAYGLKNLFETEEAAEFASKFQNITQTETLDLTLFEDLPEYFDISFVRFDKELDCYIIYELYTKFNEICILFRNITEEASDCIFREPRTKENYIKACEMARKLFLGEKTYGEE